MSELSLIVINDGNGDQCGFSYKERVAVAKNPDEKYRNLRWNYMVIAANNWLFEHGAAPMNLASRRVAEKELEHYYAQHVREGA